MPSIILSVGGGMFARSRAVEKRSIRLPNWWLTWDGWGEGGGGSGENRIQEQRGDEYRKKGKRREGNRGAKVGDGRRGCMGGQCSSKLHPRLMQIRVVHAVAEHAL